MKLLVLLAAALTTLATEQIFMAPETSDISLDYHAQRLVQMEDRTVWMSELEKIQHKAQGINFFDITETPDLGTAYFAHPKAIPFPSPNATELVQRALKTLSIDELKRNLGNFTSFRTRHYRSTTGQESQRWLLGKISAVTAEWGSKALQNLISIDEFRHSWGQNTIILKIKGSSTADKGVVILGAHQDSTNTWPWLPAPGADDDGSGTCTLVEAYRALLQADFRPHLDVEFHWYSAEEGGLLGSQAVARDYEARGVAVVAMSQFDMTAWVKRGTREEVGLISDYTDAGLTKFNSQLVDMYLDIPFVLTKCGYACSDHASWGKANYRSSFTIESAFENTSPHIHTSNDRIDISNEFSFEHMLEFSKLATAFAIELGSWKR